MSQFLQQLPEFALGLDAANSWDSWKRAYNTYERACKYHKEDDDTRIAFFLHVGGKEMNRIYRTLPALAPTPAASANEAPTPTPETMANVLSRLDDHFKPYKNLTHAAYVFNSLTQGPTQSFSQFIAEVKIKEEDCQYGPYINA